MDFVAKIVAGDETWCHHFHIASKRISMERRHPSFPHPKIANSALKTRKVMLSLFSDEEGLLLIHWLQRGTTVNSEQYYSTLFRFKHTIENKCMGQALEWSSPSLGQS